MGLDLSKNKSNINLNLGGKAPFYIADKQNLDKNTSSRHTHENKEILDGITKEKVSAWDNKAEKNFIVNGIISSAENADGTTTETITVDKTFAEVQTAYNEGRNVYLKAPFEGGNSIAPLCHVKSEYLGFMAANGM